MIDFSKKVTTTSESIIEDPIKLYEKLDRTSEAGPLRESQKTVLSCWYKSHLNKKDVVIKLHTGVGKSLIGLLVLYSRLKTEDGPCMYICPNKYLASQLTLEASKFGIPVCTICENNELPEEFLNSKRILITHVQKVFNGMTKFRTGGAYLHVGNIVLDDAHACLDSIRDAFVMKIKRNDDKELYNELQVLFEDELSSQGAGTYLDIKDGEETQSMMMIPYWAWIDRQEQVLSILGKNRASDSICFAWQLIKNELEHCIACINCDEIQIMPHTPNMELFGSFYNAKRRIFMTATTQDDSFLVRSLGVSEEAIKAPLTNDNLKWSGEKMIILPSVISSELSREEVLKSLCNIKYDKFGAIAITPNWKKQLDYNKDNCVYVDSNNINSEMYCLHCKKFNVPKLRVLVNRYDGIDLPDSSCRVLILDSLPFFTNMFDIYEETARRNSEIIKKKIAQKIEQGIGRAVRGEKDYCCILIIGSDLTKFIRSKQTRKFFSEQTQKQIEIGLEVMRWVQEDNAKSTMNDIIDLMNQCLKRDVGWKQYYDDEMSKIEVGKYDRDKELITLRAERKAADYFIRNDYDKASNEIQRLLDDGNIEKEDKGWYFQLLGYYTYFVDKVKSLQLQKKAFENNYEMLKPREGVKYSKMSDINMNRIASIIKQMQYWDSYEELMLEVNRICDNLKFGTNSNLFEESLDRAGCMLGFECQRPDKRYKKGPDNLWKLEYNQYIMFECKNEVKETRDKIYKKEVGEMNNHCGWFEEIYENAKVLRVMIIPTKNVSDDANFTHDVKIMTKKNLQHFNKCFKEFFKGFKNYNLHELTEEFVQHQIELNKLTTKDIVNYNEGWVKLY